MSMADTSHTIKGIDSRLKSTTFAPINRAVSYFLASYKNGYKITAVDNSTNTQPIISRKSSNISLSLIVFS
mgnify:FL=1